jgi:bifunctional non-homologous end joining protein LigD
MARSPAADSTTDFSALQNQLRGKSDKNRHGRVRSALSQWLRSAKAALVERKRKAHLKKLIAKTAIQFSENFEIDGPELYKHACKTGLEGVVSKLRDSKYASGGGNDWVTKTCAQRETLTIAGFALDGSKRDGLYLARVRVTI